MTKIKTTVKKEWQNTAPTLDDLFINYTPLQIAGQDEVLRSYTLGGVNCARDVRFIADIETLEHLVEVAKRSPLKRVIIPSAGITLKVRKAHTGHIYETLHLDGGQPMPEVAPSSIEIPASRGMFLGDSVIKKWK